MKIFFKNILIFFSIFFLILYIIVNTSSFSKQVSITVSDKKFLKKYFLFEEFIDEKKSINLILGSSIIRQLIEPSLISSNWFSFTNTSQNIYESYKFLDYYKNTIKIDTIIIGLAPFDFSSSFKKTVGIPTMNGNFYIFGEDTLFQKETSYKKVFQNIIDIYFPSLDEMVFNLLEFNNTKNNLSRKQGYLSVPSAVNSNKDLEMLYKSQNIKERLAYSYFYNISKSHTFEHFDLFNKLSDSLGIKVIYLISPKSKYFLSDMKNYGYDTIWDSIINKMEQKKVEIWNFQNMNTESFDIIWFKDDTHCTKRAGILFTQIIKSKLNEL